MDNQYQHRLEKAKETLLAKKQQDAQEDESHKKKKKHKDRHSKDRSRSRQKKHKHKSRNQSHDRSKKDKERDRSRDRKHKERSRQRQDLNNQDRKKREKDGYNYDRNRYEREDNRDHRRQRQDNRYQRRDREDSRDHRRERERDDNRDHRRDRQQRRDRPKEYQSRGPRQQNNQDNRQDRKIKPQTDNKDPYFQKRRQIERVRLTDTAKAERLEKQLEAQIIIDEKDRQIEMAKEKFHQAQKQMEQARRQDLTILVYCLPLKAKERDIWNFFYKANSGKIRDIQIIRDLRSRKSKGIAYVEFYTAEAVQKALLMTERPFELKGRMFMGLKIQHSQAQKNRMGIIAKRMRLVKPDDPIEQQKQTIRRQTKVFVGGLTEKLAEMDESSLKELFQPFGEVEYVDIHRDPQTGKCKGYAFIQYVDIQKAKIAVKDMNGLSIGGQKIQVQLMNIAQKGDVSALENAVYSTGTKDSLRGMLAGGVGAPTHSNLQRPPISTLTTPYLIMTGMFKMQGTTPAFFEDMRKQVQKQCQEFGTVERIFVQKNNQGNIWIKYSDSASACKAQDNLNGKYFDNKKIFCYFVTQKTYQDRVGI